MDRALDFLPKGLQVAPQETEVESYIVGGIKQDVTKRLIFRIPTLIKMRKVKKINTGI